MTTILQPAENSRRGVVVLEHSCCLAPMSPDEIRIRREAHEYMIRMEDEEDLYASVNQSSPRFHANDRKTASKNKTTGWNRFYNLSSKVGVADFAKKQLPSARPAKQQRRKTKHASRPNSWLTVGRQEKRSRFPSE